MSVPVILCQAASKRFGDVPAVDRVDFALEPGEILSILGPSGCGKTTLLRLIAGFDRVDEGEITIQGRPVASRSVHVPPESRNVGMVFQDYALFPHMTVAQNVSFGLNKATRDDRLQRVAEVVELVKLDGMEERYPYELSGGQQQRVALARTIATWPVAVLLDEPFSNLDAGMRREMRREVESILRERAIATIFVTHDREEAFAMADRVGVMASGSIGQLDTPDVIYHSPATRSVAELAATCDFIKGEIRDGLAVTEVGNLPCASNNGRLREGGEVHVLVHPDDFKVTHHPEGEYTVRSREYRGNETMLVIDLPSGATLRCRQQSYSTLVPGARVALFPEKASPFVVFDDDTERA